MVHRKLSTVQEVLDVNPFGTFAALGGLAVGTLGMVWGEGVSLGMSRSLHGSAPIVVHLWGVFFALGGALKLWGLVRRRVLMEIPGLWMLAGGYGFYALTVVVGLGRQGVVAAIISGCLMLGCLNKVGRILGRAKRLDTALKRANGSD